MSDRARSFVGSSLIEYLRRSDPTLLIPRLAVAGLLAGMLLSINAWVPLDRTLPTISLFSFFDIVYPPSGGWMLITLLAVGALFLFTLPRSRFGIRILLFALFFLFIEDVVRLQPWVRFSLLLLLFLPRPRSTPSFALGTDAESAERRREQLTWPSDEEKERTRGILRIILASIYIAAGLAKLNPWFGAEVWPYFADAFGLGSLAQSVPALGYLVPIIEIVGGLLLFSSRHIRRALPPLIALHAIAMLALLLHWQNLVVIPWNLLMIALLVVCSGAADTGRALGSPRGALALLVIGIVPTVLMIVGGTRLGQWDLYSGLAPEGAVAFERVSPGQEESFDFPEEASGRLASGEIFISITLWSLHDLGLPWSGDRDHYERFGKRLRLLVEGGSGLTVSERSPFIGTERTWHLDWVELELESF